MDRISFTNVVRFYDLLQHSVRSLGAAINVVEFDLELPVDLKKDAPKSNKESIAVSQSDAPSMKDSKKDAPKKDVKHDAKRVVPQAEDNGHFFLFSLKSCKTRYSRG